MNLQDVARRAKVSTATVSRVLNHAGLVRPRTRDRVLKAIEALNYTPNLAARSLAGGQSRTLGMVVSNLENPFFLDVYRSVEAEAHHRGYEVLVANTDYHRERLVSSVRLMIGRRVSGLALVVSEMEPALLRELGGERLPVVFYDVGAAGKNITNIKVQYRRGVRRVVEYLFALGHRRMAFVGHHPGLAPLSGRRRAFLSVATEYAPRLKVMTVADADGPAGGQRAVREIVASGFQPTAIVCVNDFMALGVLRELRSHQLAVPRDVSVTGFDNIGLAEVVTPALTTVHIPRAEIGRMICEALLPSRRGARGQGQEIVVDPELIVRESTGPAPSRARRQVSRQGRA